MVRFTASAAAFILLMPSACPASFCSMEPDWSMRNRKEAGLARLISGALLMVFTYVGFFGLLGLLALLFIVSVRWYFFCQPFSLYRS